MPSKTVPSKTLVDIAIRQITFSRDYMLQLIADVEDDRWFTIPAGSVSHIGWQAGHLAMAEYGLTMLRIRGKEPRDAEFISNDFMRTFKKGSTPVADASAYPNAQEIRDCLAAVHQKALAELSAYTDQELEVSLPEPHAVFDTKLGSLFFCHAHEMIHCGQIGILRRLLGKDPVR